VTLVGLLRHGEVAGGARYRGRTDDPLTPGGWMQMHDAVEGLCEWDLVISSPLQRCAAFAGEFARAQGVPVCLDAGLAEIDFGEWEGCSAEQLMRESPDALGDFWRDPLNHPPPGGESLGRFKTRVVAAWDTFCRIHAGKRILIVTHGGVIRMLLSHLQARPLDRIMEIEVKHAALFGLQVSEDGGLKSLFTSRSAIHGWLATNESGELSASDL
jgi:alpha-ribazole phosphatase